MARADVITLISEDPQAHGMFEEYAPHGRRVFVDVDSVSASETYSAMSEGLHPEYRFKLRVAEDYEDEGFLDYRGTPYRVIRTYTAGHGIDLYAERVTGNV